MALDLKAKDRLKARFGKGVKFDEPMSRHTYFQIGGPAEVIVAPETLEDLVLLIRWCGEKEIPPLVIGSGSNLLVKDGGIEGVTIVLTRCLKKIYLTAETKQHALITAMAGARLQALCRFATEHGLEGLNFAVGIPGTVGGAVIMNAGTKSGAMESVIESVKVMTLDARMLRIEKDRLNFSYRTLSWKPAVSDLGHMPPIVIDGRFRLIPSDPVRLASEARALLHRRQNEQPTSAPSAGCFFKNPADGRSAGEMIDRAGLKGLKVGGAQISSKHANFIINTGKASADDILSLMEIVQTKVAEIFRVKLEPEVKIVGH